MRGVELARAAGISVQQVRNYERAELIPTARRTPAGYREFDEVHRRAMVAARLLVRSYGWVPAKTILSAVHRGQLSGALACIDHQHGRLDGERARVQTALRAFEVVVTEPVEAEPRIAAALARLERPDAWLQIGELADLLGVRTSTLRFWERSGLVGPTRRSGTGHRLYDRIAARDAHLVRVLREGNFPTDIIRTALDEMRSTPDGRPDRVGAELSRRDRQLHDRSLALLHADATLVAYITWRDQHATHTPSSEVLPPGL